MFALDRMRSSAPGPQVDIGLRAANRTLPVSAKGGERAAIHRD